MLLLAPLLKTRTFLSVGTADKTGRPNAAPKFFLKHEKPYIYLIDFSFATTTKNLKENPQASLSFMDMDNLEGYRLYGEVELIEKGPEFRRLSKEVERRTIQLSAERLIEASRTGKKYSHYELEMPDKFVVIKVKIKEMTKIGTRGDFYREKR